MFLRLCWRQLLQFSSSITMCCKMCATLAVCLISLLAVSEGFFMPGSFRKQPDCVRRAPQTGTYNSQQWSSPTNSGSNNGANVIQGGFGNFKDYAGYPQQQQPTQQQQQQQTQQSLHQQQSQHSQQLYGQQLQNVQQTAPKYEAAPFQPYSQLQYSYEGVYQAPLSSYHQSVQLVPCLCPVNKEMIEQQNQQFQQQSSPVSPTSATFPSADANSSGPAPPPPQKKTS